MLVAELDDVAKAHVYRALDAHVRWCAVNAITVPNAVRALRAALSASNGQQRTEVADGPAEGDELGGLMEARLLTPDQVARRLRLSPRSVRRLIGSGVLPSLKSAGRDESPPPTLKSSLRPERRSADVQDDVRVSLVEIAEQGAEVRHAAAAATELGVTVEADWACRPSVSLSDAGKVLTRAVELRDIEARHRMAAADERIAQLERAHPVSGGIPAPPGSDAPALAVMLAFDADREQFDQ